jgi:hypothetical protein
MNVDIRTADQFWRAASTPRVLARSGRFALHFVDHLARRPYRGATMADSASDLRDRARRRLRAAVYDAVIHLFLDGYSELTGLSPSADTGPFVIHLNRLFAAFDDCYERRLGQGAPLGFVDVMGDEPVQQRLDALAAFLARHPAGETIRDYLSTRVADQYTRYVHLTTDKDALQNLERQLEMALLDSGGVAVCFAQCVGYFNGCDTAEATIDQFKHLGIVAKLADDLVDFWEDLGCGRINILLGVLHSRTDEVGTVTRESGRIETAGIAWWRRRCPRAYAELTRLFADHYDRVRAPSLRLASDLLLLPPRWGRTVIRSGQVGLRI